jgi:hypothetical protein
VLHLFTQVFVCRTTPHHTTSLHYTTLTLYHYNTLRYITTGLYLHVDLYYTISHSTFHVKLVSLYGAISIDTGDHDATNEASSNKARPKRSLVEIASHIPPGPSRLISRNIISVMFLVHVHVLVLALILILVLVLVLDVVLC